MRKLIAIIAAEYDENGVDPVNTHEFDKLFDRADRVEVIEVDDRPIEEFGKDRFRIAPSPNGGDVTLVDGAVHPDDVVIGKLRADAASAILARLNRAERE